MIIVQAIRVLDRVDLSMFARLNTDEIGNLTELVTMNLSRHDIDASGSLCRSHMSRAFDRLVDRAEQHMGREYGMTWHSVL